MTKKKGNTPTIIDPSSPAAKALLNMRIAQGKRVWTDYAAGEEPPFNTLPENIIYQQIRTALADLPEIYDHRVPVMLGVQVGDAEDLDEQVAKVLKKMFCYGPPAEDPVDATPRPTIVGDVVYFSDTPYPALFKTKIAAVVLESRIDRVFVVSPNRQGFPPDFAMIADGKIEIGEPTPDEVKAACAIFYADVLDGPISDDDAVFMSQMPMTDIGLVFRPNRHFGLAMEKCRAERTPSPEKPKAVVVPKSEVRLGDLAGYGEAKKWGFALAHDLRDWQRGLISWDEVDRGILLSGAPGTGKTTFASALARTCDVDIVYGSVAKWQSAGHMGDFLKAMRAAFKEAKSRAPCILLIDELDSIGSRDAQNGDHAAYIRECINGLLECLDGAEDREGVIVIGTTNRPDDIDAGVLRPGRLDRHIEIPLPDASARDRILRFHLKGDLNGADLTPVVSRTDGRSGADLEQVVRLAKRVARYAKRGITVDDLVSQLPKETLVSAKTRYLLAVHEAGHIVVGGDLHEIQSATISRTWEEIADGTGAHVAFRQSEPLARRDDYVRRMIRLLGGLAAEQVVFGEHTDGAGGSDDSDLAQVTRLAVLMECSMGFGESMVHYTDNDPANVSMLLRINADLRMRVEEIVNECVHEAKRIALEQRAEILKLADALLKADKMSGDEIRALLSQKKVSTISPEEARQLGNFH
ncbi:AAA family ATPase [Aliihoeflea sp. 2WW]|uniref:AAA family ATPase n=1 Tax=Aliihoeflea sp. 2WW TaxID=1381123 RepID=UPI000465B434|nr:AAA family ATPase [Aliihoeflea sp. 2WW]